MHRARRTFIATSLVALLAIAGVTAAIAADPAPPPPPKIAFLANGIVPADALAAGPIAGQLGAPIYTTQQDLLPAGTADALTTYNPELVIVMGGPVAISDAVVTQVSAATGLPAVDPAPTPATGVVRAAGGDRFETATIVADLLAAYAPAYLSVDLQAVDADLLDGKDSSAFLGKTQKATDANLLDGKDSTEFLTDADAGAFEPAGSAPLLFSDEASSFLTFADADPHVVQSLDATVPVSGELVVTATLGLRNQAANRLALLGHIELAGPSAATGATFVEGLTDDPGDSWQRVMTFTETFPVAAGTHEIRTVVDAGTAPTDYDVLNRTLTVQFYPASQVP